MENSVDENDENDDLFNTISMVQFLRDQSSNTSNTFDLCSMTQRNPYTHDVRNSPTCQS